MSNQKDLLKQLSQMTELLNSLSKNSGQFLESLQSLSSIFDHPDQMKDLLKTGDNKKTTKKASNKSDSPKITGDSFYDIFNSPNMMSIVKEVISKKGK